MCSEPRRSWLQAEDARRRPGERPGRGGGRAGPAVDSGGAAQPGEAFARRRRDPGPAPRARSAPVGVDRRRAGPEGAAPGRGVRRPARPASLSARGRRRPVGPRSSTSSSSSSSSASVWAVIVRPARASAGGGAASSDQAKRDDDHDRRDHLGRRDAEERPVVDPQVLEQEAHRRVPDEEDQGDLAGPQSAGVAPGQPQQGEHPERGPRSTRTGRAAGSERVDRRRAVGRAEVAARPGGSSRSRCPTERSSAARTAPG